MLQSKDDSTLNEEEEFDDTNIEQLLSELDINESTFSNAKINESIKETNFIDDIHERIKCIFEINNVWELGPSIREKVLNYMYNSTFSLTKEGIRYLAFGPCTR